MVKRVSRCDSHLADRIPYIPTVHATPSFPSSQNPSHGNDASYLQWKEWPETEFGRYSSIEGAYFAAEIPLTGADTVLEIGFGNGAFLGWARDRGARAFGVETNLMLMGRAGKMLGTGSVYPGIHAPELDAHRGTFSHIVAFDVIEHIPQTEFPVFFSRIADLLQPAGRCTLRFPNGDSPLGRAAQHGDPTHITTIGSAKLVYFATHANLSVEAIRAPAMPTAGLGLRRALRRRLSLMIRFVVESLIGYGYFGRRIPLDQNLVGVLVRRAL